jgi:hypothetical protein
VIAGGLDQAEPSESSRKRTRDERDYFLFVKAMRRITLAFSKDDLPIDGTGSNAPLVISARMARYEVKRLFVDQGSSADIMFWDLFQKLGLTEKDLIAHKGNLIGFTGDTISPKGYVKMKVTFSGRGGSCSVEVKFLVVDCPSAYNAILGRPTLNALGAMVSTLHMAMKFPSDKDDIVTVRGKGLESQLYYLECLKITKAAPAQEKEEQKEDPKKDAKGKQKFVRQDSTVMMTDLDPRGEFQHQRPESEGYSVEIQVGDKPEQVVKVGKNLPANFMKNMIKVLQDN